MIEMTASEASRGFSSLLDLVEQGETVVVTRGGYRIAVVAPAGAGNGSRLQEVFDRWSGTAAVDEAFAESVEEARRAASASEDSDPWLD